MMKLKKLFIVCVTAATSLLQPAYAHTEGNYVPSNLFDFYVSNQIFIL